MFGIECAVVADLGLCFYTEGGSDEESGRSRASSGSEYSRQTSIIMQQMANRTRSGVLSRLSKILEGRDVVSTERFVGLFSFDQFKLEGMCSQDY